MLSLEPRNREREITGLKPIEIRMYDLAWKHNQDGFGFTGLCNLWYKEISPHITLAQIQKVWARLEEYMYFHNDRYLEYCENGYKGVNDYVPCIQTNERSQSGLCD